MQHLNPYRFYELASRLHALFSSTSSRVSDMFGPITEAQAMLDGWIKGDPYTLETSKADAERLLTKLGNLFNKYYIDQHSKQLRVPTGEDRIDAQELTLLYGLLEKFEHALAAELTYAPTYLAGKRGIYSTYDLIQNAQECFSQDMRRDMPEASMREFNTAGRALAFGLGTAAGVHLLRAVELVLKKYYETFSGTIVTKNERTYSIYLKRLAALSEEEGMDFRPDKRLLQLLAQIKEHYRNPLTNPETNITVEQATSLFGLATAAMTLMTEQVVAYLARQEGNVAEAADEIEEEEIAMDMDSSAQQAHDALSDVAKAAEEETKPEGVKEEPAKGKKSKAG
ncbi:MAG: hypothetical protein AB7E52_07755 [Bdellovibrionales bacterium]